MYPVYSVTNLSGSDHINPHVGLPNIVDLLRDVVDKLATHELDVRDADGHWYSLRIRPYKTVENHIDGVLLAVVDIDSVQRSAARAEQMLEFEQAISDVVQAPVAVVDGGLRVQRVNSAFTRIFGLAPDEVVGRPLPSLRGGSFGGDLLRQLIDAPPGSARTGTVEMDVSNGRKQVTVSVRKLVQTEDAGDTIVVGFSI